MPSPAPIPMSIHLQETQFKYHHLPSPPPHMLPVTSVVPPQPYLNSLLLHSCPLWLCVTLLYQSAIDALGTSKMDSPPHTHTLAASLLGSASPVQSSGLQVGGLEVRGCFVPFSAELTPFEILVKMTELAPYVWTLSQGLVGPLHRWRHVLVTAQSCRDWQITGCRRHQINRGLEQLC